MSARRIAVVGDVLLDVDIHGGSDRLCPEAPAPVVDVTHTHRRAGGAGLVARMLHDDGHEVVLVTALSDDDESKALREALGPVALSASTLAAPTPVKTRLLVDDRLLARMDHGCGPADVPDVDDDMLSTIAAADVVVVADYGRGMAANERLRGALEQLAPTVPIVWDPHPRGPAPIPGVAVATPNTREVERFAGDSGRDTDGAAASLRTAWRADAVLATCGADGAVLVEASGSTRLPTRPLTARDTCGAGDRLAATLAAALAAGAPVADAARAAVVAATRFVDGGAAGGLAGALPEDPLQLVERVRSSGGTVVATGGCFDLLHAGHARTLAAARALGDCLIVLLNSDASVRGLKGPERPIVGERERAELLRALDCVDAVVVFEEATPENALEQLRPDIWVKGGDYRPEDLPETELLRRWGGRTVVTPYHEEHSTTLLAAALRGEVSREEQTHS